MNFDIDKAVPNNLIVDGTRLKQIILNLVSNSIKFTDKGSVSLMIKNISPPSYNEKVKLKFIIKDTGCGIDAKDVPYLF